MSKLLGVRQVRFPAGALAVVLAVVVGGSLAACDDAKKGVPGGGAGMGGAGGSAGHPLGGDARGGSAGALTGGSGGFSGDLGGRGGASPVGGNAGGAGGTAGNAGGGGTGAAGGLGGPGGAAKGVAFEPYFHAGTRLKPRAFHVGDIEMTDPGEQGWYDAGTGNWCNFAVGADGIERCYPVASLGAGTAPDGVGTYLDAACTRPAVHRNFAARCDGLEPHHVTLVPASGCGYRTYRLGAALPSSTRLYSKTGGACRRLADDTNPEAVLPIEEVPVDTFLAVKRVSRPRHPSLNAWVREGEDGSSQIVGFVDPSRQVPCYGLGLYFDSQACVPGWMNGAYAYADAACGEPVGVDEAPRCSARTNTVLLAGGAETVSSSPPTSLKQLWESGPVRSSSLYYVNQNGVCQAGGGDPVLVHERGAPIDLASLPQLEVLEVGRGPLTLTFYGVGGVPYLPAARVPYWDQGRFTDVARGKLCAPTLFKDGVWRCVPSSFAFAMDFHLYYQSTDCTGDRAYDHGCGGAVQKPEALLVQDLKLQQCGVDVVTETVEFGECLTKGPISNASITGTCRIGDDGAAPSMVSIGKALNPDDLFARMERKLSD